MAAISRLWPGAPSRPLSPPISRLWPGAPAPPLSPPISRLWPGAPAPPPACMQRLGGAVASPFDCYLVLRGIRSLFPRMRMHCESALQVCATGRASAARPITPHPPCSWPARSRATLRPSQCSTRASRRTLATPPQPGRCRAVGGRVRRSSAACCPCVSSEERQGPWPSRTRCASLRAQRASAAPSRSWSTAAPLRARCRRRRLTSSE